MHPFMRKQVFVLDLNERKCHGALDIYVRVYFKSVLLVFISIN